MFVSLLQCYWCNLSPWSEGLFSEVASCILNKFTQNVLYRLFTKVVEHSISDVLTRDCYGGY